MVTSGTSSFSPSATQIITSAYRKMAVINEDEQPTAGQFSDGLFALNAMTKEWEATGIHVWTEEEAILFLQQNQRRYLLGGTTTDHCSDASSWILSTLASNYAAGATAVQTSSPIAALPGDNFGIVTNLGNAFWTTVQSVSGATVNLAAPLSQPCSAGAFTFDYPVASQIVRPLRVPFCRRLQYALPPNYGVSDEGGIITPLSPMMARKDYFDLPQPNNPGLVTQAYYNPARDQGEMWVWNVQQNANFGLRFTYYRPIQDWTTPANTADLPQEWSNALIWNLAQEMMLDFSVSDRRATMIALMAAKKLELVQGFDREDQSIYFGRSSPQSRG
jgi:hypothetical protein